MLRAERPGNAQTQKKGNRISFDMHSNETPIPYEISPKAEKVHYCTPPLSGS